MTQPHEKKQRAYRAGVRAELLTAVLLTFKGYRVLARRYKSAQGEIDLIVRRGRTLVFVEVKARAQTDEAAYAISPRQQDRIRNAAQIYLAQTTSRLGDSKPYFCRFDAVLVSPGRFPKHLKDAWT